MQDGPTSSPRPMTVEESTRTMKNLITRRNLLRFAGLFGAANLIPGSSVAEQAKKAVSPAAAAPPPLDPVSVYKSIGVRPLINCRGTLTVIGGSMELPEVRAAKNAANHEYAQLDEVMDAVGKRLGRADRAPSGAWSAPAAPRRCRTRPRRASPAAIPISTCASPISRGFAKDEVIIPGHSRNVYDAAIRAVGVKIVEVDTPEALRLAIGPKTAMIYIFAGTAPRFRPDVDRGHLRDRQARTTCRCWSTPPPRCSPSPTSTCSAARRWSAIAAASSSAGRRALDCCSAARTRAGGVDSQRTASRLRAGHEGRPRRDDRHARGGRELGQARSQAAEWKEWVARCDYIGDRVAKIPGVTAIVQREPGTSLSNRSPRVSIRWDSKQFGLTGAEAANLLDKGDPRIALGGGGGGGRGDGPPMPVGHGNLDRHRR